MAQQGPETGLADLLEGKDAETQEKAWSAFLERYSRLIIHTARSVSSDHDTAMNAYAFVLEELKRDEFRRLRHFQAKGRAGFTTWFVVVTRRLCLEYLRKLYGRVRDDDGRAAGEAHDTRKRLVDLVGTQLDLARLPGTSLGNPDDQLREADLVNSLEGALAELPAADRLLLSRRFDDGLSVREIARLMRARSVFFVYRRLKSVLGVLRQKLEGQGIDGPTP